METVIGVIDRIVFQADDSDYKIFNIRKMDKSKLSVQGEFPELFIGTKIEVHGDFVNHKKYGRGFRADAHTFAHDDNPNSIRLYLQSIAKWIGPQRSKQIVDKFGTELDKVLAENPEKMCEIEGIGKTSALSLAKAWLENKEMKNIRMFLQSLGLTPSKIKKIIASLGPKSEKLLKENPYLLCDCGFGFSTCDSIAQKLNIGPDSDIRYIYFIKQTLKECLNSGHLFLMPGDIVLAFNKYNKVVQFKFNGGRTIEFDLLKPYLRTLRYDGYIYVEGSKFYDLQSYFYESDAARMTYKIMNTKPRAGMHKVPIEKFIKDYENTFKFEFSSEQKDALTSFVNEKIMVVTGGPGTGKCLGYDTPILMFDGSIKKVQDIKVGDFLMGDDSTPREVLSLARGEEELYKVTPKKGDEYIVNKSHILSLKQTSINDKNKGKIHDICLKDYLNLSKKKKSRMKGYRVPVEFNVKETLVNPYLIGMWLGNGAQDAPRISTPFKEVVDHIEDILNNTPVSIKKVKGNNIEYDISRDKECEGYNNLPDKRKANFFLEYLNLSGLRDRKHIPKIYKLNDRSSRLSLLAGIIDSDGWYDKIGKCYDIVFKSKELMDDTVFVARSLGFSAYPKPCKKTFSCIRKGKKYSGSGTCFRATISGNGLHNIPCVVNKKKAEKIKQIKDNLVTGIEVTSVGVGKYYGFQITGNGRFLLGDFTVTHNTTVLKAFVQFMRANNLTFELLTPTGISAKKLGDTAGHTAMTIHRRLGYKGNDWDWGAHNKYSTDVVIVDETSMVDMEVYYRLVSALYPYSRIVFVGDYDQLPSVGPGCVLRELVNSKVIKTIFLNTIFRQAEQSDIIAAAARIKKGDTDLSFFKSSKKSDIWFLRDGSAGNIEQIIIKFAKELKNSERLKTNKQGFQIITPRNTGPLSVETLNIALQSVLNPPDPEKKEVRTNSCIVRKGDRVIIKKNNYELGVYNGDIGKVISISPGHIIIDLDDFSSGAKRRVDMPISMANDMIKLAYAITVHKCAPIGNRILTDGGLQELSEVKKNNLVVTDKKRFKKIKGVHKVGIKKCIGIRTKTGEELRSGEEHRHKVCDSEGISFVEAKDIKPGMFLISHLGNYDIDLGNTVKKSITNSNYRNSTNQIDLKNLSDEDFGWLLGALTGDGCVRDKKNKTIELTCPDNIEVLDKFKDIMGSIGLEAKDHCKKGRLYSRYVCSVNLRKWLENRGVGYDLAKNKKIPLSVFTGSTEVRRNFIAGYIDTDGSVSSSRKSIRITTASKHIANNLSNLIKASYGVICFKKINKNGSFCVSVFGRDCIQMCRLGINLSAHNKAYEVKIIGESKEGTKTNHHEIPFGKQLVSIFKENFKQSFPNTRGVKGLGLHSQYRRLNIKLNDILRDKNKLRRPVLEEIFRVSLELEGIKGSYKTPEVIRRVYEENLYFDEVIGVQVCPDEEMIDIEVEEDNIFVMDGFITHNSQGLEYPLVILPFIKAHGNNMLQRNLLYTAITRAKKKVIVLGQGSAIQKAIENDKIQRRNTIFGVRVKKWMTGQGTSLREHYGDVSGYQNAKALKQLLSLEEKTS